MKRIALDVMGGDLGISASVPGLDRYIRNCESCDFVFDLFGNEREIMKQLRTFPAVEKQLYSIHDTSDSVIQASEKPAITVKKGRGTSMFEAIAHVANGKADAVVSSGNTGAFMVLSKFLIGTIDGIDRPALVSMLPNANGKTVMLDLGANTLCTSTKLVQFALMGRAVARVLLQLPSPRVGLLNIGTERSKGTEELEEAYTLLENTADIQFVGFVEGTDITNGKVDVVVTDGFSGNVALKTMEGTVKYITDFMRKEFAASVVTKIGYMLSKRVFDALRNAIDPRVHNGAPLVGLNKVAVKSHGSSDEIRVANAISVATNLVTSDFIPKIEHSLAGVHSEGK
ncbi:MAG: phosphate acyltransferase PlsX [Holosporales bacterium]|jgi:glycerol-3-phosphate acyltransferase PlsX|nr:phosphate acyltransferase PlsX [Holosporales bacterium]